MVGAEKKKKKKRREKGKIQTLDLVVFPKHARYLAALPHPVTLKRIGARSRVRTADFRFVKPALYH
jgi:hypothetical protein